MPKLHDTVRRGALHELHRRRAHLPVRAGRPFDDVGQQCADDALVSILPRVDDFKGLNRFTTWGYKFAGDPIAAGTARA
ncbi:MAG: hypothetical protein ACLPV4_14440 [Solirubrobacteraceae bacterium]